MSEKSQPVAFKVRRDEMSIAKTYRQKKVPTVQAVRVTEENVYEVSQWLADSGALSGVSKTPINSWVAFRNKQSSKRVLVYVGEYIAWHDEDERFISMPADEFEDTYEEAEAHQ